MIQDRVGTLNERETVPNKTAEADLHAWLADSAPELAGLNEWSPDRDQILQRLPSTMKWTRPEGHGPVALWNATRYELIRCWGHTLVKAGYVGRLPGRKSNLPASIATCATFQDEVRDEKVGLIVCHLTAEVQNKYGDYHPDASHKARVRRHKKERRALKRLVKRLQRRGCTVFVVGDTNYQDMPLRPLISCWRGKRHEGTLGGRCVDYVYGEDDADHVRTWKGHSDHKAVVAVYKRD